MKLPKQVLKTLIQGIEIMIEERKTQKGGHIGLLSEIVVLSTILDWANAQLKRKSLIVKINAVQAAALLWFFHSVNLFEDPYLAAHLCGTEQYLTNFLITNNYKLQ